MCADVVCVRMFVLRVRINIFISRSFVYLSSFGAHRRTTQEKRKRENQATFNLLKLNRLRYFDCCRCRCRCTDFVGSFQDTFSSRVSWKQQKNQRELEL
jgi:hypothetical protein